MRSIRFYLAVAWTLLRYRVALMLWMFMYLPIAAHHRLGDTHTSVGLAALSLAASYIAATSVNDIADRQVDKVNHPHGVGRPLVSGQATLRDMWVVHIASVVIAFGAGIAVSPLMAFVMCWSLATNWLYSLPPIQLSYRSTLAPIMLTLGYVGVPYATGLIMIGDAPSTLDATLGSAVGLLFLGRIVLKDFRDRQGDSQYGKPTLLLKYGKGVTCLLSATAVILGSACLAAVLAMNEPTDAWIPVAGCATLLWLLMQLHHADDPTVENEFIALGAMVGNALLICVMAAFALGQEQATTGMHVLVTTFFAAMFLARLLIVWPTREQAVAGYRG